MTEAYTQYLALAALTTEHDHPVTLQERLDDADQAWGKLSDLEKLVILQDTICDVRSIPPPHRWGR